MASSDAQLTPVARLDPRLGYIGQGFLCRAIGFRPLNQPRLNSESSRLLLVADIAALELAGRRCRLVANATTRLPIMVFTADQAKVANYACAIASLIILTTRLLVSRRHQKPLDLSFWLVIVSMIIIVARIAVVYLYLLFGTAADALKDAHYFNTHDLYQVEIGSILSLVARVLVTASYWLQICLLLLFYSHIMDGIRWVSNTIKFTWVAIVGTFIAVVFATLLECQPFHLYWQISPDPGSCVKGYYQLLFQCVSNICLDILLLVISYPILICTDRTWKQHLRVLVLFLLGTFCIIITVLRLYQVYSNNSAQPTRSLWASTQMVVSTFVANAPTIYGEMKVQKRKKSEVLVNRRMSRPNEWGNLDIEASHPEMMLPERAATHLSQSSNGSSTRKEWFDHTESLTKATPLATPCMTPSTSRRPSMDRREVKG